jgi:hypothetical protein
MLNLNGLIPKKIPIGPQANPIKYSDNASLIGIPNLIRNKFIFDAAKIITTGQKK